MKHFNIFAAIIFLLTSGNAFAAWGNPGSVSNVRLFDGKVFLASLSSVKGDKEAPKCVVDTQFSFKLGMPYTDSLLSILLAAKMAEKKIRVDFTGQCEEGRPEINGIQIVN